MTLINKKIGWFLLFLLIFLFIFPFSDAVTAVGENAKCPPPENIMPCRCRERNKQIQVWCSHSDLERVNGALENLMKLRSMPAIDELIVENNRMPNLPARAFGALRIARLLLRNNGLESVSRNAFAGLEGSIEELYIVEDKLVDFPFDSIENLKNLEAFTMERSQIRLLPRFNGLNKLKHIRIDGSLISGFPVGAFAKMANIKQIHIVNSNVASLANGIFGPLDTLLLANFSGNRIDLIQRRSFALLPKLEVLSLSNNLIQDAISIGRAAEDLSSLKSVDLSGNQIKSLPEGSFVNLRSLQVLNLASNLINIVSQRSFTHLPGLRKVDLSSNFLRNFPKYFFDTTPLLEELRMRRNLLGSANEIVEILSSLRSLRYLDLGENGIESLPKGAIQNHTHLERLDLSDNKIFRIYPEAFNNMPSLLEMSLRNNSITDLPVDDGLEVSSLKELDLSSNQLHTLPSFCFKGIPNLSRLDLSRNSIKIIPSGVFNNNKQLELLDLTSNAINYFAPDSLAGLYKLNKFDLSFNHLDNIPKEIFKDLKSLQYLNIKNNRVKNVPTNLFENLKSLEELNLRNNIINFIPIGFFNSLENLRELNLKHNSLSEIQENILSKLKKLEILKLANNKLSRYETRAFDDLPKLRMIDLSFNRLAKLNGNSFKNLPGLEKFDVRENRIKVIEKGVLENSKSLHILDMASNGLSEIPPLIQSIPSIKVIDLSHNAIKKVEKNDFKNSANLVEIYLNDNQIKDVEARTFEKLDSLTIIDLDENEMEDIASETFMNLPKLIYLRMSRGKIRTIQSFAFSNLIALDGIDLQENELETIADNAFLRTSSLKYMNLSHNNFDSLSRMGIFPLTSLEVLDVSFNRIKEIETKSLRHLQWLVELRLNDNGICRLSNGIFDGMSRLKMLVLRNNYLNHLFESVFYKLKGNIAFIDISGNPISCDCDLIWLRNMISRESVLEMEESTCGKPKELKGETIKALRPARMVCSDNLINQDSEYHGEAKCPQLPSSKKRVRPSRIHVEDKPLFGNNPGDFFEQNVDKVDGTTRRKDEKLMESNDYISGDTPTIYAASEPGSSSKEKNEHPKKSNSGGTFGIGSIFGIPLPSFDFGLNLGISPSISFSDKDSPVESNRGFAPGIKGPDPLPSSWVDRPSKAENGANENFGTSSLYEPPEYIPRRPPQSYIPLNPEIPYSETNVPSGSKDYHQLLPIPSKTSPLSNSPSRPFKFPTSPPSSVRPNATPKWQSSTYPEAETGFIPIEPFFHNQKTFTSKDERNKGSGRKKGLNSTPKRNQSIVRDEIDYNKRANKFTPKDSTTLSSYNFEFETTQRPYIYSSSVSPGILDEQDDPPPFDILSDTPDETDKYDESIYDTRNKDEYREETSRAPVPEDFNLSDFWSMFGAGGGHLNPDDEESDSDGRKDNTEILSPPFDIPLNFSDESHPHHIHSTTDRSTSTSTIRTNDQYTEEDTLEGIVGSSIQSIQGRKPLGRPIITKLSGEEIEESRRKHSDQLLDNSPDELATYDERENSEVASSQLVPPVIIGSKEAPPIDWYYNNYNSQNNAGDELEKYLERSRQINRQDKDVSEDYNPFSNANSCIPSYFHIASSLFISLILHRL